MKHREKLAIESATRHSKVFELCDDAYRACNEVLKRIDVKKGDVLNGTRVALLVRIMNSLESGATLAARGFAPESRIILRSQLEAYFKFAAICRKPELIAEYLAQHFRNKKQLLQGIRSLHQEVGYVPEGGATEEQLKVEEAIVASDLTKLEAKFGRALRKEIKPFNWAMYASERIIYFAKYVSDSAHVHVAPTSLNSNLIRDENGDIDSLFLVPESVGDVDRLVEGALVAINSGLLLSETLAINAPSELAVLRETIDSLYADRAR